MSFDQDKRRDVYVLRFDDTYPGLQVQCRKPGHRQLRQLTRAVLVLGDDLSGRGLPGETVLEAWDALFKALQASIMQWNLTDRGRAVPVSRLLDQDDEFLLDVARAWYARVVLHRPQPVDRPVDTQEPGTPESQETPAEGEPVSPWGGPGVDEEWLAQFPMHTNPGPPAEPGEAVLDPEDDPAAAVAGVPVDAPEPAGV